MLSIAACGPHYRLGIVRIREGIRCNGILGISLVCLHFSPSDINQSVGLFSLRRHFAASCTKYSQRYSD